MKRTQSTSSSSAAQQQVELLDSNEQQRLIDEIREKAEEQSRTNRAIFSVLYAAIVLLLFMGSVYSSFFPWELDHQRHFQDLIPFWAFPFFYVSSMYCFVVGSLIVKNRSQVPTLALVLAHVCTVGSMLGWLYIFWTHAVTNPVLYWLPFANLGGLHLALYVDRDTIAMIEAAKTMQNYTYDFKKV